jgi:hypothetical protein
MLEFYSTDLARVNFVLRIYREADPSSSPPASGPAYAAASVAAISGTGQVSIRGCSADGWAASDKGALGSIDPTRS